MQQVLGIVIPPEILEDFELVKIEEKAEERVVPHAGEGGEGFRSRGRAGEGRVHVDEGDRALPVRHEAVHDTSGEAQAGEQGGSE